MASLPKSRPLQATVHGRNGPARRISIHLLFRTDEILAVLTLRLLHVVLVPKHLGLFHYARPP